MPCPSRMETRTSGWDRGLRPARRIFGSVTCVFGWPPRLEPWCRLSRPLTVALMADYNQSLTVTEAIRRGRALDGEGLYRIEEPTRHDDYSGCARIAAALKTPVQIGENFAGAPAMATALAGRAC